MSEPEIRQVTLPAFGGRVIIASDGLWDSITPKTAAHHVRGMPATKAARELGQVRALPMITKMLGDCLIDALGYIDQLPSARVLYHGILLSAWETMQR